MVKPKERSSLWVGPLRGGGGREGSIRRKKSRTKILVDHCSGRGGGSGLSDPTIFSYFYNFNIYYKFHHEQCLCQVCVAVGEEGRHHPRRLPLH